MKRRKLLSKQTLQELTERLEIGVPLATAIAKLDLDISRPSAKKLLDLYAANKFNDHLFPPWLKDHPAVQEQPDNWVYIGYFGVGEWKQCKDL